MKLLHFFEMIAFLLFKPDIKIEEYTVSLQNGKWHQVSKSYDGKGKVVSTSTVNLRRM